MAFKHVEARFKSNKLAARAKKLQLVRYNTRNITYQLWDSAQPHKTTNSAELSFREKETRDVVPPKAGYDPFPEPGKINHQPRSTETKEEENEDEETVGPAPQAQQQGLRLSDRLRKAPDVLNLHTLPEETYDRTGYALIIGDDIGNIGTGRPGEVGYMPADPSTYDDAVSGAGAEGWIVSMRDGDTQ